MDAIILRGVKTHNLKNLDLILPHGRLYVVTGVSGSGKSSLSFDTLYAEGQRRYVESLSSYARQFLERMEKPNVDSVTGIPPAIAIEAKNVITNARSTVGTQTEINDYLRVLFSRVGRTQCPDCGTEVVKCDVPEIARFVMQNFQDEKISILFPVDFGKKGKKYLREFLPELERQGFDSFRHEEKILTAGNLLKLKKIPERVSVVADQLRAVEKNRKRFVDSLETAKRFGHGTVEIAVEKKIFRFTEGYRCFTCFKEFREPTPNLFSFNSPLGACPQCQGFGRVITLDWNLVVPDPHKSLFEGAIEPWTKPSASWEFQQLLKFCRKKKIPVSKPWKDLSQKHKTWVLHGLKSDEIGRAHV